MANEETHFQTENTKHPQHLGSVAQFLAGMTD